MTWPHAMQRNRRRCTLMASGDASGSVGPRTSRSRRPCPWMLSAPGIPTSTPHWAQQLGRVASISGSSLARILTSRIWSRRLFSLFVFKFRKHRDGGLAFHFRGPVFFCARSPSPPLPRFVRCWLDLRRGGASTKKATPDDLGVALARSIVIKQRGRNLRDRGQAARALTPGPASSAATPPQRTARAALRRLRGGR